MYFYAYKNVQVDKCHVGMVTVREFVNKTALHRKHHGATSTRIAQMMLSWAIFFLSVRLRNCRSASNGHSLFSFRYETNAEWLRRWQHDSRITRSKSAMLSSLTLP